MPTRSNVAHEMAGAEFLVPDPGDTKTITMHRWGGLCEVTGSSASEYRYMPVPQRAGLKAAVRLLTAGSAPVYLVINSAGVLSYIPSSATLNTTGQIIDLLSVSYGTGFRWVVVGNVGTVTVAY